MSTQATAPPRAVCVVCLEEEDVSIRIGGDPVCEDCVHAGIIPKFVNAWKHEADYPPTWGRYRLHPSSFKAYIKDGDEFLTLYRNREYEYNTPIAKRLYCQKCQAFCGKKDPRCLIRLCCGECKALICEGCGVPCGLPGDGHVCAKASDPFEGLVRGKDFQVCPREDCGMKVELKDGCNAMRCTSSSCNQSFCFICGEATGHDSKHWQTGGKCPRFNQPGSQNAQFDRVRPEARHAQPGADMAEQNGAEPDAIEVQQLINEIDQMNMNNGEENRAGVEGVMRRVGLFVRAAQVPMPGAAEIVVAGLAAEANIAAELQATPMGTLMHHQQGQLRALSQVAETMITDHEAQGRDVPAFLPAVIDVILKLHLNLDMYIYQARFWVGYRHFRRRHGEIWRLMSIVHPGQIFQHFPTLFRIWFTYTYVAEVRMPVAHEVWQHAIEEHRQAAREEAAAGLPRVGDAEAEPEG